MKDMIQPRTILGLSIPALILVLLVSGQEVSARQTNPPKQTVKIAMRDGVKLATDVYLPGGQGPFPVVLVRLPYNKEIGGDFARQGTQRGYAVVIQDTRGRYASEGENLPFEGDGWWAGHWDGYDTVEWIVKQPWANGKIGTWGGSALGITQLGLAGTGTKHLTCQHITVATPRMYHHAVFPGGVFKKALVEDWTRQSNHSPDSVKFWTAHPTYDDFWRERDVSRRFDKINVPAVHIGGWFDIFAQGTIDAFVGYQTKGGPNARGKQKLVMGPWTHGVLQNKAGELTFPKGSTPPNTVQDPWRWFDHYLKGIDNGVDREPAVTYYVMGDVADPAAPGNVWRTADRWPPLKTDPTRFYFQPDRSLSNRQPASGQPITYEYDPKNPVPSVGGPQLTIPAGPMDQRKIESRPDVILFTSDPLPSPIEVTGPVQVRLWASSDAPDTDFVVKLCDVYPDGRSINLCEGVIRARFRESLSREKLIKPGEIYAFTIDLWSTSVIFNKGHQIRVQVTSSSSPGYDPNPNTGEPFRASDRTRIARNTIYVDAKHPSHLLLPVVKK